MSCPKRWRGSRATSAARTRSATTATCAIRSKRCTASRTRRRASRAAVTVSEPLRLGLVGCGSIAQAHAAALRFLTDDGLVRVTAAADPDPAGVERVAQILGGIEHTGTDCYAVIDHPDVDAVVNITPTRFHRDYVAAIAQAGKPCFTEKPLAPTFDVVRDIVQIVRDARHPGAGRVPVAVPSADPAAAVDGRDRRSRARRWRTRCATTSSGRPAASSPATRAGDRIARKRAAARCSSTRSTRATSSAGCSARSSGSTRRRAACSATRVEDVAALTIEHRNGVVGNLVTVFNGVQHREERRLEVFFERASVELTTDFLVGAPEDSFLVHRADEQHAQRYDVDGAAARDVRGRRLRSRPAGVRVPVLRAPRVRDRRCATVGAPSPDVDDALRAHALVEAAYRSAAGDRRARGSRRARRQAT